MYSDGNCLTWYCDGNGHRVHSLLTWHHLKQKQLVWLVMKVVCLDESHLCFETVPTGSLMEGVHQVTVS